MNCSSCGSVVGTGPHYCGVTPTLTAITPALTTVAETVPPGMQVVPIVEGLPAVASMLVHRITELEQVVTRVSRVADALESSLPTDGGPRAVVDAQVVLRHLREALSPTPAADRDVTVPAAEAPPNASGRAVRPPTPSPVAGPGESS